MSDSSISRVVSWHPGLPAPGSKLHYVGESNDGRMWILRWDSNPSLWRGAGFAKPDPNWMPRPEGWPLSPEIRTFRSSDEIEGRDIHIYRHFTCPNRDGV